MVSEYVLPPVGSEGDLVFVVLVFFCDFLSKDGLLLYIGDYRLLTLYIQSPMLPR